MGSQSPDVFVYNPPAEPYLDVMYEDGDIVVVVKPAGILSVPGKAAEHRDSILARVSAASPGAAAVHRLDLNTSGIMVVAKNRTAAGKLGRQFQERKVRKIYFAWVGGVMAEDRGTVDKPLCPDPLDKPRHRVDWVNGREAVTAYICLYRGSDRSFAELRPRTGRSHQLRVHMASIGHPILGDRLYAPEEQRGMAPGLQLHAGYLAFRHPTRGEIMEFNSPPPFAVPAGLDLRRSLAGLF